MNFFEINALIALNFPNSENGVFRVLYIDQPNDLLVALPMPTSERLKFRQGTPVRFEFKIMQSYMDQGLCTVLDNDPWRSPIWSDEDLTEAQRTAMEANWQLLAPLLSASKQELFDRVIRGQIIQGIVKSQQKTKASIYRLLFRYWRGGQTKSTLVPNHQNKGNRGQSRPVHDSQPKRGRPRRTSKYLGAPPGINVTEQVKLKLVEMGQKFYEKDRLPLVKAYADGLLELFKIGTSVDLEGKTTPIMPPEHELPTFPQFRYWYGQDRSLNFERSQIARLGQTEYNLTGRALSGESTSMAFGPGALFQVDAMIAGIYLVSSKDPNIIVGKPVVYGLSDVFSRMVVGFWVGLEGPSWAGAIQALVNMVQDKVIFCKEIGIEINDSDWPSCHLPEAILADRGEFEGYSASQLVNDFNVSVSNTAPYRADWKGIIERKFGHTKGKIINWLDGAIRLNRRGETDARLKAIYTLKEFRQILALHFLDYNNTHEMEKYPRDIDMKRDRVRPIPIKIWNWGLENRTGKLKSAEPEVLRMKLLPRDHATITRFGIKFKNYYYTCTVIENEQWREKAAQKSRNRVTVAYDTWSSRHIYVRHPISGEFLECFQTNTIDSTEDAPWPEVDLEKELDRLERDENTPEMNKRKRDFQSQQREVTRQAKIRAKSSKTTESKRSRLSLITENRGVEKNLERTQVTNSPQDTSKKATSRYHEDIQDEKFSDDIDELLANIASKGDES